MTNKTQMRVVMSASLNKALRIDLAEKPQFKSKAELANHILERHYKLDKPPKKAAKKPQ